MFLIKSQSIDVEGSLDLRDEVSKSPLLTAEGTSKAVKLGYEWGALAAS
jgi:hypothetical protein